MGTPHTQPQLDTNNTPSVQPADSRKGPGRGASLAAVTPEQREAAERNRQAALQRRALRELQLHKQKGQQQLHKKSQQSQGVVYTTPQTGTLRQAPFCWRPRQAGQQHEQQRQYSALQISVHASEVAALAGMHPRQSREEAILRLWRRVHPRSFRQSAEGARLVKAERLAAAACAGSAPAQESLGALKLAESICGDPFTAAQKLGGVAGATTLSAPVAAELQSPASLAEQREVRRCIKSRVFQSFGRAREDPVFELLRGQGGLPDLQRDSKVYRALVDEGQQHSWVLSGRIDGKVESEEGGLVVVEIKNRVRRLFHRVRRHERVQVESYLRLLGADRAALAECFTGRGGSMDVLVHWVDSNDSLWEEQVLPSLRNAVMDVRARAGPPATTSATALLCPTDRLARSFEHSKHEAGQLTAEHVQLCHPARWPSIMTLQASPWLLDDQHSLRQEAHHVCILIHRLRLRIINDALMTGQAYKEALVGQDELGRRRD